MKIYERLINAFLLHGGSVLGIIFRADWIRKAHHSKEYSKKKLLRLLQKNSHTEYGLQHGFETIRSIEDFQDKVPLSNYEDYEPYIRRILKSDETDLIVRGRIHFIAMTSGTTHRTKLIPHTAGSYFPYFKWLCIESNNITRAMKSRGVPNFNTRGILLTEIASEPLPDDVECNNPHISVGGVSAFAVGGIRLFLPLVTQMPAPAIGTTDIKDMMYVKARYALQDKSLTYMCGVFASVLLDFINYIQANHQLLIHDIETGSIDPSIQMSKAVRTALEKKLQSDRERAAELREIFSTDSSVPIISRLWPNMSYVFSIGTGNFAPFTAKMRTFCKKDVRFGFVLYSASEALIGCALHYEEPFYLLVNDDAFFEFLPVDEPCDRPLLMHQLKAGKLYELIITNISGLYRYQIRDVIRVLDFEGETPYVEFVYRADRIANLNGIHFTDQPIQTAIRAIEETAGTAVIEYSVFSDSLEAVSGLELFIEPDNHIPSDIQKQLSQIADQTLCKNVYLYQNLLNSKAIVPAKVHVLKHGTYAEYRKKRIAEGASLNQLKSPRVIETKDQYDYFKSRISPLRD